MKNQDEIISFDALWESMEKCRKGVIWKDSVASFVLNAGERVMRLEDELKSGKYEMRPPYHFTVTYPKKREIASVAFRDRVYQRSINDNELYPVMTRSFILDNWACQKGKGTTGARDRFKEFIRRFYRKHGINGYYAKFDVKQYYQSMKHDLVEDMFKRKLDEATFGMVQGVLRGQFEGDTGYNPGSQMIQIAGISTLNSLDHFIKERLHIELYIRYMDDFILIHEDKDYLEFCKNEIEKELGKIGFILHETKTKIFPVTEKIRFLGFDFRLTETGKVIVTINPQNVKAERKKLYRLVAKSKRGEIPRESVDESYRCWRQHASYGNSYKMITRMDKYYRDLWKENRNAESST